MKHQSNIERAKLLIERYFDATASEAEERELRLLLTSPPLSEVSSPELDEARAVMGYFAVGKPAKARARRRSYRPAMAAAVTLAIVSAVAIPLLTHSGSVTENRCIAYVGHQEITDNARVLDMMNSDLAVLGDVSETMESDFEKQLSALGDEFIDFR